jgi:hypothetical protein
MVASVTSTRGTVKVTNVNAAVGIAYGTRAYLGATT